MDGPGIWLGLAALLAALALVAALATRQRRLIRRVGSFTCCWAAGAAQLAGVPGVAQYGTGRLDWWRSVSLLPRPARSWSREQLEVVQRQELSEHDERGRLLVRVSCRHGAETFTLTMSAPAYAGLVSWLEARPRRIRTW